MRVGYLLIAFGLMVLGIGLLFYVASELWLLFPSAEKPDFYIPPEVSHAHYLAIVIGAASLFFGTHLAIGPAIGRNFRPSKSLYWRRISIR